MTIQTRTIHAALAETPDIEALAARAVALGRELAAAAHACYAGGGSIDAGLVERCLQRLGERVAFDGRDFAGIAEARALIARDLEGEVAAPSAASWGTTTTSTGTVTTSSPRCPATPSGASGCARCSP